MKDNPRAQLGLIGLGVMGKSLALNLADHGVAVAVWNRSPAAIGAAVAESGGRLAGAESVDTLVASLERPRRVLLMVPAGAPVDAVLGQLVPHLEFGDVVIDGGNSWFEDTRRRERELAAAGLAFVGLGVSGGEEGARHGPSLMPGGTPESYALLAPVLESIAAHTDSGPCVTHVGTDGAGHFVKMVHNGIEYADMQFIAEAYHLLRELLGLAPPALAEVFAEWNRGPLESFLVEITAQIFRVPDEADDGWLVDRVLDRAGQKGTGRWTAQVALDLGVPIPSIAAAIDARVLSSRKADRERFAPLLSGPENSADQGLTVDAVRDAMFAAKVGAYAQGLDLIRAGAAANDWSIDLREIARIWKGGCIIRARFLDTIMAAYESDPDLPNLLLAPSLRAQLPALQAPWRAVVGAAQRDAFGAHTYQRVDDPDGPAHHSDWLGAS